MTCEARETHSPCQSQAGRTRSQLSVFRKPRKFSIFDVFDYMEGNLLNTAITKVIFRLFRGNVMNCFSNKERIRFNFCFKIFFIELIGK